MHALDLPGFGTEHARGSPSTAAGIAEDVRARWLALRETNPGPWGLLGMSLGGMVTMAWCRAHPRDFDNSAYHMFYRDGVLHRSDGAPIRSLAEGLREPAEGALVFKGDADNVAWVSDIHIDLAGRPFVAYTVQKDSAGLPPRSGGEDLRYRFARWTGDKWQDAEIEALV